MRKIVTFSYYYLINKIRKKLIRKDAENRYFHNDKRYASRNMLSPRETNEKIYSMIMSGEPFFVGRYGASELFCASTFEFDFKMKQKKSVHQLVQWSGFFTENYLDGAKFNSLLKDASRDIDLFGVWNLRFEEYYIRKYMKKELEIANLFYLEPWMCLDAPWSRALKGKRVLIIHPFENSIREQYKKREQIFPGTEVLPEFELLTLKAVQTVAGNKDERFSTWFEALEWMKNEALRMDFDIAIIGCGAYGFPLAAKLKEAGKQAIHLGGATQLLFGIKGKRWDEVPHFKYVRDLYNDSWCYPKHVDKINGAEKTEGGSYW